MTEWRRLMFCHCEKNGGTTLIHQFRSILGIRHVDLIPLDLKSNEATARDVASTIEVAPFAVTIAGHSLKPHIDYGPGLEKFTLLRDPVDRYLSEFRHDSERRGYSGTLDEWMELTSRWNYQTKFMAGKRDAEAAKNVLASNLTFFGFTDRYDEFLRLIAVHLGVPSFSKATSDPVNQSRRTTEITPIQRAKAEERNALDIELISYARGLYAERVEDWLSRSAGRRRLLIPGFGMYGNLALRNLWYKPKRGLRPSEYHALPVNAVNAQQAENLGLASFD